MPAVSIADHASATECASSTRSRSSPSWSRTWSRSSPSAWKPEAAEHRHRALLLGDDVDGELLQPAVERLQQRPAGERAPQPLAALRGIDDEADVADVVGPAGEPDDGDVADDGVVLVVRERAPAAIAGQPALDGGAIEDLLLEERALGLRDAGEELQQPVEVGLGRLTNLHRCAP